VEHTSYRNIWQISYPLILSGVAFTVINVTDMAFLGRVSEVALGAVGLGSIYYFVFMMAAIGIGIGGQIIMARFDGEKRPQRIGPVFDHLLYIMVALALLLYLLYYAVTPHVLRLVITSDAIYDHILRYLDIRVLGLIPAFLFLAYRSFLTGVSDTRAISYASGAMALSNVLFNYLLVFGNWGFPRLELEGAAYASVMSEVLSLFIIVGWMNWTGKGKAFGCHAFPRPSRPVIASILDLGIPVMFQNVVAICSWLAFFTIIESMGERQLAISNVARSVYSVLMIPLIGISQAAQSLVSNLLGQGRPDRLWQLISRLIKLSLGCSLVLLSINLIEPRLLLVIFTDDPMLVEGSIPVIHVLSVTILFFAVAMTLLSCVSGTGATKTALTIEVITLFFYLIFVWATVKLWHWPLPMVWLAEFVYFFFIGLLSALYLWSGRWRYLQVKPEVPQT
jgi:putative MATE family efflux protein